MRHLLLTLLGGLLGVAAGLALVLSPLGALLRASDPDAWQGWSRAALSAHIGGIGGVIGMIAGLTLARFWPDDPAPG